MLGTTAAACAQAPPTQASSVLDMASVKATAGAAFATVAMRAPRATCSVMEMLPLLSLARVAYPSSPQDHSALDHGFQAVLTIGAVAFATVRWNTLEQTALVSAIAAPGAGGAMAMLRATLCANATRATQRPPAIHACRRRVLEITIVATSVHAFAKITPEAPSKRSAIVLVPMATTGARLVCARYCEATTPALCFA
jgi:hypothetical protein